MVSIAMERYGKCTSNKTSISIYYKLCVKFALRQYYPLPDNEQLG